MAVAFTDKHHVAIIDTVTDQPLEGLPCFDSEEHAQDFLDWLRGLHDAHLAMDGDPRRLTPSYRRGLHRRWVAEQLDAEGELLNVS